MYSTVKETDMYEYEIKMAARYIVLAFFMYLAYNITRPEWIMGVKEIDPMTLNVIFGSVFGALTWIMKSHFETTPTIINSKPSES